MDSKCILICLELLIIQAVYSQCVNRVVQGPNGPIELLPNQVLIPPGFPYIPQGQQRQVLIPGPNSPCQPAQPIVVPTAPIPEYTSTIPTSTPAIANFIPSPNIPGNVFLPNIPPAYPNIIPGNVFVPNIPSGNLIVPNAITENYAPTILHDNSVANSLANALQLLVVSSLLGNTLPEPFAPPCYNGYTPGYNYVY